MSSSISPSNTTDRAALWSQFLQRWPLESLQNMQLDQYTGVGNQDTFCYWIESRTEDLGSIWGGSAFKFGVYARRDQSDEPTSKGRMQDAKYGWLAKYGATAQDAFLKVRSIIVDIASSARAGQLDAVEMADLGEVTKWKLAFLYQDRNQPCIVPLYKRSRLQMLSGLPAKASCVELQRYLADRRGDIDVLSYGDALLSKALALESQILTTPQALAYLQASERFQVLKPPTENMAGFRTADGRELALAMDNQTPTIYASPGEWLNVVREDLGKVRDYEAGKSRSSSLAANAPALALGNAIVSVTVPTMAVLDRLCEAYDGTDLSAPMSPTRSAMQGSAVYEAPLNQILYGPPGTGKTYATVDAALGILDPDFLAQYGADRSALKSRFDALTREQRVRFVTFHQSFSYEDFVEGLRATTDEETQQLRYEVVDGVFKSICTTAEALAAPQRVIEGSGITVQGHRIWKMSLGDTQGPDAVVYEECLSGGFILLGYGNEVDFTGCATRQEVAARYQRGGITIENAQRDYAVTSVLTFVKQMAKGDLVVVTDGNLKFRAIGEITGDYTFEPHPSLEGYGQRRAVRWLRDYTPSLPYTELMKKKFSQMTLYELQPGSIDLEKLQRLLDDQVAGIGKGGSLQLGPVAGSGYVITKVTDELVELTKPNGNQLPFSRAMLDVLVKGVNSGQISIEDIRAKQAVEKLPGEGLEPFLVNGYPNILAPLVQQLIAQPAGTRSDLERAKSNDARVLIIDEINRGNIARIFGELITLLEPSKRAGAGEALEVVLPYSKQPFSVPKNVHLIGTMNTADRSLTGLDVALRRRFVFKAMPPQPEMLDSTVVDGLVVGQLLRTMNLRIEALLDRDHCLGHAYFMPLRDDPSLARLGNIFRNQVLPLLQEYFFDDWQRIQWVLNDHRKPRELQFVQSTGVNVAELFGAEVNVARSPQIWAVNEHAFTQVGSYLGIVDHAKATGVQ